MKNVNKCRCCNSKKIINLKRKKTFYLLNLNKKVILGYSVCQNCGFIFQNKYLGDNFLEKYYQYSPANLNIKPLFEKQEITKQVSFARSSLDLKNKKIYEIGPGSGGFMEYLKNKYSCKVYLKN